MLNHGQQIDLIHMLVCSNAVSIQTWLSSAELCSCIYCGRKIVLFLLHVNHGEENMTGKDNGA